MADRTPAPPATGPAPVGDRSPFWPWLLLLVVGLTIGVLLAWRPWADAPARADAEPSATPTPSATAAPSPSASASAPASTTVFDEATAPGLFFTDAELARAVPDAPGLSLAPLTRRPGDSPRGPGSRRRPAPRR